MQENHKLAIFTMFSVLLLSQVSLMAFAHHNDDAGKKARQESETKTKKIEEDNDKKAQEKKDAWKKYKESFKSWKTAKANYKIAKINGDQDQIESTKIILDKASADVKKAWNDYQKLKKE